ncbi:hypothetical protein C7212DRAFT_359678 [Tuber magnatum]|uniref:Uncharacterized protein n=1 Tax=Tuber magnatum TaxID=42249 RepID=A0A317SF37_9PEZI|nr:hypothetical protein C7212DRAFT_359678 [Tuber magnatum]
MGWFWGSSSPKDDGSSNPLSHLDPALRDFLLKESPLKPSPPPAPRRSSEPTPTPAAPETPSPTQGPRTVNSPYGDRYADIWAQYTPQGLTQASKSSQEQLADILQAYKYRKSLIARAALENCVGEQSALHECYRHGSFAQKARGCGVEKGQLQDCYTTQTKFLQAMGYMSDFARPAEVDERIQMHADKLYQEQVRQDELAEEEKRAERAAREGRKS